MAKIFICIFVAVFAVTALSSPIGDEENEPKPGYCRYEGIDIKEGETVPAPIGNCYNLHCDNATDPSISSLTCAQFRLKRGSKCQMSKKDLTKPYPQCCPKKICPAEE